MQTESKGGHSVVCLPLLSHNSLPLLHGQKGREIAAGREKEWKENRFDSAHRMMEDVSRPGVFKWQRKTSREGKDNF